MSTILIVDDEPQIRRFIRASLSAEGYDYIESENAETALRAISKQGLDLIILDLGLPDQDGYFVLQQLRRQKTNNWQVPVLILSARDDEYEIVKLLRSGASDYLTKPFGVQELMARIHVLLRDFSPSKQLSQSVVMIYGDLSIDKAQHRVNLHGQPLNLSKKEFALLNYLAEQHGRLVTQPQLLERIWGPVHKNDNHYLRIFISQLRKKLGDNPNEPKYIETEPGVGYRFLIPPSNS